MWVTLLTMAPPPQQVFILGTIFLLAIIMGASSKFNGPEQCSWLPDSNITASTKFSVTCKVRNLDGNEANNISGLPAESTSRLKIKCNPGMFLESVLPSDTLLQRLQELEELQITNCKLLSIVENSFRGQYNLKRLSISTLNSEWGPSKSLELNSNSFTGLKELLVLDMQSNNLRTLPDGAFCTLPNLQTLNLTRNRIKSEERIRYAIVECGAANSVVLQYLDLSHNELRIVTADSGLTRLKRLQQLNLQSNNISEISGDSLTGLFSLRVLNLANNHIEAVPDNLFSGKGDYELRELYLQNNSLFSLANGLFHRLEQLLVLDLSANQLTSNHIDAGTFGGLIRLIVLNLSHNALTRIDGRTFKDLFFLQILDLRNNSIGFIEDNAFLPLYNLHTLNLAENRINTIGPLLFNGLFVLSKLTLNNNLVFSIDSAAFRNCSALKELDLSSNALLDVPDAIRELSFLKTLDLGENQISDFHNGSFANLNQLTGLRLIDNNVGNITRGMLWDLPSLQVLNLAKNKIQSIERGAFERNTQLEAIRLDENFLSDINGVFATLASLLWLNLSENHLVWFDYAFIPSNLKWLDIHGNFIEHLGNYYKIQDDIRVKTLDASHNRITEISSMSIPNSIELLFINNNFVKTVHANTFMDKTNLVRVDMYANDLVNLDLNALRLPIIPRNRSLPEVYLGGNPFNCDCTMEWMHPVNNMSTSRQYPHIMDLDNVMCRLTHSRGMTHVPLIRSKPSDFVCTYETHCFALCHCCDFDACDCEMTCPTNCSCYHDHTWNTNVVDCSRLGATVIPHRIPMDSTELYLDGNQFRELPHHVFIGRKNVRVLYVNSSGVETVQNSTFNGLHALQILHLEENRIGELHGYEFEHLSNLRELYLQDNLIARIDNRTFQSLHSLSVLRLDGNRLVMFPVWLFSGNANLIELSLGGNRWSCRCKFLQEFTEWLAENSRKVIDSIEVQCYNGDEKRRDLLDFNGTAVSASVCSDYYAGGSVIDSMLVSDYWKMVVVTLCVVIFALLIVVLWCAFRDPLRVWLYSRYGVRLCSFRAAAAQQFEDRDKLYDAFVCYSPKDEEWVVQALAGELDTKFQLCLHYRDLPHAAYLQHAAPAVLEAAEASRRVILVLTRNFLQTEWSRFELRQALHEALKGRIFKLVVLEDGPLPEAELDPELRPYLKTGHRVRWGERRFWEKLRYCMPASDGKIHHSTNNYRRNINNYTIDSRVVVMTANGTSHRQHQHNGGGGGVGGHQEQHHLQQHAFPEKLRHHHQMPSSGMQAPPPAYSAATATNVIQSPTAPSDADDANYSSATTATPSPKPLRRAQDSITRPISDHIYSSIDSDYSTLERAASGRRGAMGGGPPWRPSPQQHNIMMHHHHHHLHHLHHSQQQQALQTTTAGINNNGGQAYLV